MRVALLITCLVDVFEPDVGTAAVAVLEAAGCTVECPLGQTCCGQPAWNAGFARDAARVAATTLGALEEALTGGAEAVVAPAGSCTTMIRVFWPELFEVAGRPELAERARAVTARTFELTEFLAGPAAGRLPALTAPARNRVAWHHSCHLLRELDGGTAPVELLRSVAGCEQVPWSAEERCCGFGGMFSFELPETAEAMADDKLRSLAELDPPVDLVASADSSCLMHLRGRAAVVGHPIRTRHVAQVLADALPTAPAADGAAEPGR